MIVGWARKDDGWYATVRLCSANLMHLLPDGYHYDRSYGGRHWPEVDVPITDEEYELFADWSRFSANAETEIGKLREQMDAKKRALHDAILRRISK